MLNVRLLVKKAKKLLNEGDYSAAEEVYRKILNVYPENKAALKGLSILASGSTSFSRDSEPEKKMQETHIEISSLLASYGFNDDLTREEWRNIFAYHESGNYSGLKAYISELLIEKSSLSILHNMAAFVHYDLKEFDSAIEEFRRSLILDPYSYTANLGIAQSMASLGHFQEAKSHLDMVSQQEQKSYTALKYLGATLASLGNLADTKIIF